MVELCDMLNFPVLLMKTKGTEGTELCKRSVMSKRIFPMLFYQMIKNENDPLQKTYKKIFCVLGHSLSISALGLSMFLLGAEVTNKSLPEGDDSLEVTKTC